MQWIGGDSGQPRPPAFVRVGHKAVLIDLNALYPNAPHFSGEYHPDGLQIRSVHLGVLTEWGRDEWGAWYGKVTYTIAAKDRQEKVTHWVPAWALRPADCPPGDASRRRPRGHRS
ncbi:hypothetical protein [Gordonia rhizosphera]|uniref:Uncharacterized protein n=1 Tax=Gordonia rhizosphera NBRC 16068 TaxID=1108045 RepID=K6WB61_9ACTN|nr:hypothetical protein [Gordonia rhizosphera]GAB91001.1 hypothetical protein GORHZ_120_00570 [Gordonia rhizosphera NBRC 16068]